jgi:serine/threonine protein kinase
MRTLMKTSGMIKGYVAMAYLVTPNQQRDAWVVHRNQKRALKVLHMSSPVDNKGVRDTASNLAEAQREVEVQRRISVPGHSCVCQLHECLYDHEFLILVLDFCDDSELFNHIADVPQAQRICGDTPRVKQVFRFIMEGIYYLHATCNVTHRDIKCENVMLTRMHPCYAKLIDFGFVLDGDMQPASEGRRGTISYMAPEQYTPNGPWSGFKADIWGCGVILFMLLAAAPPLDIPDKSDPRFAKICDESPGALLAFWNIGGISHPALDLLAQMLREDPAQRWDAQRVLTHPWLAGTQGADGISHHGQRGGAANPGSDAAGTA